MTDHYKFQQKIIYPIKGYDGPEIPLIYHHDNAGQLPGGNIHDDTFIQVYILVLVLITWLKYQILTIKVTLSLTYKLKYTTGINNMSISLSFLIIVVVGNDLHFLVANITHLQQI